MVRKRYLVLAVLIITLVGSLILGWHARRVFGEITIEKYDIVRSNGRTVSFRVYAPTTNTYGQPRPSVVTIHGISSSGPMMDPYNIELARRNFTVISIDLTGHGRSSETFGFEALLEAAFDAYEAVRYVQANDPDTHDTIYGVLGHSLGAGVSLLFQNVSVLPQSTVIIGGGMGDQFGELLQPINQTSPRNLMLANGVYDELVSLQMATDTLAQATGLTSSEPQKTYGDFTEGTARKLVLSLTNHLFETSDSMIIAESVDWLVRSLQGVTQREEATLDPTTQVYQMASLLNLVATVSFVFGIFPVILIFYSAIPIQFQPERLSEVPDPLERRTAASYSIVVGLTTAAIFLLAISMGLGLEFAGLALIQVSFGTGLTALSFLSALAIYLVSRRYLDSDVRSALTCDLRSNLVKAILILLPVLLWVFAWSFVGRVVFDTALPFTFALDSGAPLNRLWNFLLLAVFLFPLFYQDTLWLNGTVGTLRSWDNYTGFARVAGYAMASRVLGLLILIAVLYVPFLIGLELGFIMFIALLMLPFMVVFGFTALVTVWVNGIARSNVTAAMINSVLVAILVASSFQLL